MIMMTTVMNVMITIIINDDYDDGNTIMTIMVMITTAC